MRPSHEDLQSIDDLYDRGLYLQAYARASQIAQLKKWEGLEARLLAGRLASQLGAMRLGATIHILAGRAAPNSAEAVSYHAMAVQGFRGPLAAWKVLSNSECGASEAPENRAAWLATHAFILLGLRDFVAAERWVAEAEAVAPEQPGVWLIRTTLLNAEDRYEEALETARHLLKLRPSQPRSHQAVANALTMLGRDEQALEVLSRAAPEMESGFLYAQLAELQTELGQHEAARASYEHLDTHLPLKDAMLASWLLAQRSDTAYYCGDLSSAKSLATQVGHDNYTRLAEKLAQPAATGSRTLLPVSFVRQHHMTCAPATLTAISRFWSMPAEHLEIAEAICYDGTPCHSERNWAETHGWTVREFTVDWDSATSLLDRGVPFTLAVFSGPEGHLQAVIGYDAMRRSLIVRDPTHRRSMEYDCDAMIEAQHGNGPRGMALVPDKHGEKLRSLELPDADLYNQHHRVQTALERHDRIGARKSYDAMAAATPGHRLTLMSRRALAAYDADQVALLSCYEAMTTLYPDNDGLQLGRLASMQELRRRDERLALLKQFCDRPQTHPTLWLAYASELMVDAREHEAAERLVRRAIRVGYIVGEAFSLLSNVFWAREQFDESLQLARFAICLNDRDENLANAYFQTSHHLGRSQDALTMLRERFSRFGKQSGQPARTLFNALGLAGRTVEAVEVLNTAIDLRPQDDALLLFAADWHASSGNADAAQVFLDRAKDCSSPALWLRSAGRLAQYRGDLRNSLDLWGQVLDLQPTAIDAHLEVADRIAQLEGRDAALRHVRDAAARYPNNCALHRLWYERIPEQETDERQAVLRRLIEINPVDVWARRELAMHLGKTRQIIEAFAELAVARGLQPRDPVNLNIAGVLHACSGQIDEARVAWRDAVRQDIDNGFAIARLVESCGNRQQRLEALDLIRGELSNQRTYGIGVLAYFDMARPTLDPDSLLIELRSLLAARPDIWHTWSTVVRLLHGMGRRSEAIDLSRQATSRFPFEQQLWNDLACALDDGEKDEDVRAALLRALHINPTYTPAIRHLVHIYQRADRSDDLRSLLEDAIARDPLDAEKHLMLATALWNAGDRDAAVARITRSLVLDPARDDAWAVVGEWKDEPDSAHLVSEVAREVTRRRPADPNGWLVFARALTDPDKIDDRFAAIDRAISLDPLLVDAHDLRVVLLARTGRLEEARAVCRSSSWGDNPPVELTGRAAWIEASIGRLDEAIKLMSEVVARSPNYGWGWNQLTEWHDQTGNRTACHEAAGRCVDLSPVNPLAHARRAHACIMVDDRRSAKHHWQQALKLAPGFVQAAQKLLEMQIEDAEFGQAADTIAMTREHVPPAIVKALDLQLAFSRTNVEAGTDHLRDLCLMAHNDRWPFDKAAYVMRTFGMSCAMEAVILAALDNPKANPLIGEVWAEHCVITSNHDAFESGMLKLSPGSRIWSGTVRAYLGAVAGKGDRETRLSFIRRHEPELRADAGTWGEVGSALLELGEYMAAMRWQADWPTRDDLEPWMLLSQIICRKKTGLDEEAVQLGARALSLPDDHATPAIRVWQAHTACVEDRHEEARAHLSQVSRDSLAPYYQFLHALVLCMLTCREQRNAGTPGFFGRARRTLHGIQKKHRKYRTANELRRAYEDCAQRIARDRGGVLAYLWYLKLWLRYT